MPKKFINSDWTLRAVCAKADLFLEVAALVARRPKKLRVKKTEQTRESQPGRAEVAVLITLAEHMAIKTEGPRIIDTCYPTLPSIAEESGYSLRQVQDAIANLRQLGYIETSELPWYVREGRKSDNHFSGLRFSVGPKWEAIVLPWEREKGAQAEAATPSTVMTPQEQAETDRVLASFDRPTVGQSTDEVFELLQWHFAGHKSMTSPDARRMMRGPIQLLLDKGLGKVNLVHDFFQRLFEKNKKLKDQIMSKQRLGGYLVTVIETHWSDIIEQEEQVVKAA